MSFFKQRRGERGGEADEANPKQNTSPFSLEGERVGDEGGADLQISLGVFQFCGGTSFDTHLD